MTVPLLCILNIGTVPMLCILNVWTILMLSPSLPIFFSFFFFFLGWGWMILKKARQHNFVPITTFMSKKVLRSRRNKGWNFFELKNFGGDFFQIRLEQCSGASRRKRDRLIEYLPSEVWQGQPPVPGIFLFDKYSLFLVWPQEITPLIWC